MTTALKLPDGKTYKFAPATFTKDVVRCVEILEEIKSNPEFNRYGELLRVLREVIIGCLIRGGHSEKEADQAVSSLPLGKDMITHLDPIRKAIGLDE